MADQTPVPQTPPSQPSTPPAAPESQPVAPAPTTATSPAFIAGALLLVVLLLGGAYFLWQGFVPAPVAEEEKSGLSPEEKLFLLEQLTINGEPLEAKAQALEDMEPSNSDVSAEQKADMLNTLQE
jgi:uncharacterized protein HemX